MKYNVRLKIIFDKLLKKVISAEFEVSNSLRKKPRAS